VNDPSKFLNAFAQALSAMTLYPGAHPSRERAVDAAYEELCGLEAVDQARAYTFLDDEVVYGKQPLREMKSWDWAERLVAAGIQRLEFEQQVGRDQFDAFLEEVLARLTLSSIDTGDNRQMRTLGVRFGAVGLEGLPDAAAALPVPSTTLDLALGDEADTFRWLQSAVQQGEAVPLLEADAVVRSLSVAMHSDRRLVLPLLQLKEFDQYTTTHSLNVAVLSMALAEALGCRSPEVRAIGVAGLLHDIGKIRIPIEILTKPGKFTEDERHLMDRHPIDGARIILQGDQDLDLAATVAYEHHIMLNGDGYPSLHYRRECVMASRLVHVCDVYDALITRRPYRDAWPHAQAVAYLDERAGLEFDPQIVQAFMRMMGEGDARLRILDGES
jgi:putative nucleotidyltransferase with HDIG domain